MRIALLLIPAMVCCLSSGCCKEWQQPQPKSPESTHGWESKRKGTVIMLGEFVLNEGQSTQSESIGVQVVKISPLITCLGPLEEPPRKRVTLRVYDPRSANKVLCETTIGEDSGSLPCATGNSLPSVSINGINTKDRWVHLSLNSTAVD